MKITTCPGCGQRIFWATTTTGSKMPVNADKTLGGNVRIESTSLAGVPCVSVAGKGDPNLAGYTSHFVSCLYANVYRKKPDAKVAK